MSDGGYEVEPASLKRGLISVLAWTVIIFFALTSKQDPEWASKTLLAVPFLTASALFVFAAQRLCRVRALWIWEFVLVLGGYYILTLLFNKFA